MTLKLPIFMDNHSTTAVDLRVVQAMLPYFTQHFGNAASRNHSFGWQAEAAVENARGQVASVIGGDGKEIVWTSGATESNNLALKGAASFLKKQGNHFITVETEHKSVLDTCKRLEREGCEVTYLRPAKDGLVTPEQVVAAMTDKTICVSIMVANNEIGVVQPINAIGAAIKARNPKCLFHTDAVQATSSRSPRTRSTDRRASVRCGCAASRAFASIRSSMAAVTSAVCARARCPCR
jgi:cysteine desulfurase